MDYQAWKVMMVGHLCRAAKEFKITHSGRKMEVKISVSNWYHVDDKPMFVRWSTGGHQQTSRLLIHLYVLFSTLLFPYGFFRLIHASHFFLTFRGLIYASYLFSTFYWTYYLLGHRERTE